MGRRYIAVEDACIEVDKGDLLVGNNAEWAKEIICRTPAADVVERSVYEQIKWERDIAMGQLEDAGIPFGGKTDVAVVKHGHWFINEYEYFSCSVCGDYVSNGCDSTKEAKERLADGECPNYCPNCGAKMDGG